MRFFRLILKNIWRNPLRSVLTALGTMLLVLVVTMVWSILAFLDEASAEKNANFKVIVTERWQIPSRMPYAYAPSLCEGAAEGPDDVRPLDSMTWSFYGGGLDPDFSKRTRENTLFAIAMEPDKVLTMLDDIDTMAPAETRELAQAVEKLKQNPTGIILGQQRLRGINKKVGERIKIYSVNYRGIDLEFEIVGVFPPGRYDETAVMHRDYLLNALDEYARRHNGQAHPMAQKALNLVWLRVPDRAAFSQVARQITDSPRYSNPAVKCETAASGVATFLESFRDLIWGMRYLLAPAALVTLSLVIANAISISVRERRTELAVMKVLGFQPGQILLLVLGESLLVGTAAGLASVAAAFAVINYGLGGIKFPIGFFGSFYVPIQAFWWGPAIGALTSLAGSIVPAWSARSVKVSDVFAKVA